MRNGEARALRWCDIDFEKRSININHTLIWKSQEAYILDTPKTKTSKRQIPMLSQCYEILREIKTEAGQAGLCGRENFVFCLSDGVPINRWRVAIELEKIESAMQADGIEIGHFTCHSLRHTFATRAIENGMKPQVLKTILGHSSLYDTDKRYDDTDDRNNNTDNAYHCFQHLMYLSIDFQYGLEILSVGSEVQILSWTPVKNAESLCFQWFSAFLI